MLWFDKGVIRPAGSAIPFAVLAARILINAAADRFGGGGGRRVRMLCTLGWSCVVVYGLLALSRVLLYLAHYYAMEAGLLSEHVVSDHLFLGGTILASLQSEGACLLSDVTRHLAPRVTPREVALSGTFLAALGLYLCTAVDMYFTARYFHYPLESLATAGIVFVLFQAPVLRWLARSRRRAAAQQVAYEPAPATSPGFA